MAKASRLHGVAKWAQAVKGSAVDLRTRCLRHRKAILVASGLDTNARDPRCIAEIDALACLVDVIHFQRSSKIKNHY